MYPPPMPYWGQGYPMPPQMTTPQEHNRRMSAWIAVVGVILFACAGAAVYAVLSKSSHLNNTQGNVNVPVSTAHATGPHLDPQLHTVKLGQPFYLGVLQVTVTADATRCMLGGGQTRVIVPVALHAPKNTVYGQPFYELLDGREVPYTLDNTYSLDPPRGTVGHAAPPLSTIHQGLVFTLPTSRASSMTLETSAASGTGNIYRVAVSGNVGATSSSGGAVSCSTPGGTG